MKKHIISTGVPRSGKSTISQRISGKLGYQHISMDSIITGIESVFHETGINSEETTDLWEISNMYQVHFGVFKQWDKQPVFLISVPLLHILNTLCILCLTIMGNYQEVFVWLKNQ